MSDRMKGISNVLQEVFLEAVQAMCCNYIANNIQANYRVKCRPLFQACAKAKISSEFKTTLQELLKQSLNASEYVNKILYKSQAWFV